MLVSGGAGFIGARIVEVLLEAGYRVRVLDDCSSGRLENLGEVLHRVEFVRGDIRDPGICKDAMAGVDYLLHQAALTSIKDSIERPAQTFSINVQGSANLFEAARDARVKRIVYASSASVYGQDAGLPNREGCEGSPTSPYAISKWMLERMAAVFRDTYGMDIIGLRYFNVYGPRQNAAGGYAAAVPRFFHACSHNLGPTIYGNGEQTRDFVFVDDVARANLLVMSAPKAGFAIYNVGTGAPTRISDLASHIATITGYVGPSRSAAAPTAEVEHSIADCTRFDSSFGPLSLTPLATGLAKTAKYYR